MERGACYGVGLDLFFPEKGETTQTAVKTYCNKCEVREDCLEYAVTNHIHHGVWGGLAEKARNRFAQVMREQKRALLSKLERDRDGSQRSSPPGSKMETMPRKIEKFPTVSKTN